MIHSAKTCSKLSQIHKVHLSQQILLLAWCSCKQRGKTRHWLERYHFVVSTLTRFEDKFRSANQIDGISIADGGKMADS